MLLGGRRTFPCDNLDFCRMFCLGTHYERYLILTIIKTFVFVFLLVYNFVCSDVIVRSIRKVIGHGRPLFYKYGHKPQEKETLRTKKKKRGADNLSTQ